MPYGLASRDRYVADLLTLAHDFPTVPSYDLRCILAPAPFFAAAKASIQLLLDVDAVYFSSGSNPSNGPGTEHTARKEALTLLGMDDARADCWHRSGASLTFALATMLGPEPAYLAEPRERRAFLLPARRKRDASEIECGEAEEPVAKKRRASNPPPASLLSDHDRATGRPTVSVPVASFSICVQAPASPAADSSDDDEFYTCPESTPPPSPAPAGGTTRAIIPPLVAVFGAVPVLPRSPFVNFNSLPPHSAFGRFARLDLNLTTNPLLIPIHANPLPFPNPSRNLIPKSISSISLFAPDLNDNPNLNHDPNASRYPMRSTTLSVAAVPRARTSEPKLCMRAKLMRAARNTNTHSNAHANANPDTYTKSIAHAHKPEFVPKLKLDPSVEEMIAQSRAARLATLARANALVAADPFQCPCPICRRPPAREQMVAAKEARRGNRW
ncbi:hypothetical protein C8R45DRAFT_992820 [Mycena sanguinolenta]|nr:hypothetical protein C8R45DRAFT_992820 [Mycena sanguinolenta]